MAELESTSGQGDPQQPPLSKKLKRTRVSVACQRCKSRKQKCNGDQPQCSTCVRLNLECRYVVPMHPKPQEARQYIKALENRVAELELFMAKNGQADDFDHLALQQSPSEGDSAEGAEVYSLLTTVRDISLNTSGSFVGGTSNITLARILESVVDQKMKEQLALQGLTQEHSRTITPSSSWHEATCKSPLSIASPSTKSFAVHSSVGDKLLRAYLKDVSGNFPVVHSIYIQNVHWRRHSLIDVYKESILHLVYALGGQFLKSTKSPLDFGGCHWKDHFEAALDSRKTIMKLGDTRTLTILLLLVQHCLRVPKDPASWTFTEMAMRLCVELGLHRRKREKQPTLKSELENRLFWSCYYVDRDLSIALGRPPCISDHDIDVQLPLDVDENTDEDEVFRQAVGNIGPCNPPTRMTCFIHIVRLKRIESDIQHNIYRVEWASGAETLEQEEQFLNRLTAWKNDIPHRSREQDAYMVSYNKCMRLLLQPQLYEPEINERYLKLCMEACSGVCEKYRSLHNYLPVAFSTLSLQTVFIAGLTLVYCLWHSPSSTAIKYMNSLSDCSIILYIMTERWPSVKRYRDAFESINRSVLQLISEDKHRPLQAIPGMTADVRMTIQGLDVNMKENLNRGDLEQMIGDMTGEHLSFWNDTDMELEMKIDEGMFFPIDDDVHFDTTDDMMPHERGLVFMT